MRPCRFRAPGQLAALPRILAKASATAISLAAAMLLAACLPDPARGIMPDFDLDPPDILEAGPEGGGAFLLLFDEEVEPVRDSFSLQPLSAADSGAAARSSSTEAVPGLRAESRGGGELLVAFGRELAPGEDYALAGEAEDGSGNRTRFVFRFPGYNPRPAGLRLSELEPQKNSSTTKPHRDFLELEVVGAGNLGGMELSWASSVKTCSWRFPGVEVRAGDFVVLHLAPQGLPEERNETGSDLSLSGGVDSSPTGRDFWSAAGALPDESAAILLRERPGGAVLDALFYAALDKTGELAAENRMAALVLEAADADLWPVAGSAVRWEEAFRWSPGSSRSLCREGSAAGAEAWRLSAASTQSPGLPNPP